MTLFSEDPPQASVICDLMRSLLIITSVVLITKGIIMRLPEEAAAGAEAGEFSASEAPPGSLARRLPPSVTRHREHFIFILIKL